MDKWHGMTMEDIRALEEETKKELDEERAKVGLYVFKCFHLTLTIFQGELKGTAALDD